MPNPWWTPAARAIVAATVRRRLRDARLRDARLRDARLRDEQGTDPTAETPAPTIYSLDLPTLRGREHPLLPDPLCPACGTPNDDSADAAIVTPTRRPKPRPDASRLVTLEALRPRLEQRLLDAEVGLVQELTHVLLYDHVALATATMRVDRRDDHELGIGRTQRFDRSRAAALLEALERHAGHRARARRTAAHASTAALGDDALQLPDLGLHDDIAYEEFGDQLTPYTPDLPLDWVWGYSLTRRRPLLVPEHIAYYLSHTWRDLTRCVYEISNGCALGSCDEEAILHGLLEVAERDAFLLTWYRRRRPPRIDFEASRTLTAKARRLRAAGYRVHVFDTTTDLRIPAAMVVLEKRRPGVPHFVCTAGAGLRTADAVDAALDESAVCLSWRQRQSAADTERARSLLDDARSVRAMKDHALLYTHPDAAPRLHFLLDDRHDDQHGSNPRPTLGLGALDARHGVPPSDDLSQDLETLLERVASRGLDVVTVDQSPPVLRDLGLACRKVLVPGTLTMTFGHSLRRLRGLPRLLAPLGPDEPALDIDDINPWPHPFP